jgi:hypothetical protein
MQDIVDLTRLQHALNDDPEFRIAARHWTTDLCLKADGSEAILLIREGVITGVNETPISLDRWDVMIAAPGAVWHEILRPIPRPFYQDFFPAMLYHGLEMRGDLGSLFAYYPAVRRMGDVMRAVASRSPSKEASDA